MVSDNDEASSTSAPEPREGAMDVQLSLAGTSLGIPRPDARVLRRNGRIDSFDALKIARTIERAGRDTQELDRDTSFSLASAVALYLTSEVDEAKPLTADAVHTAVESVLRQMGYSRTARSYLRHGEARRMAEGSSASATAKGSDSYSEWDWKRTAVNLAKTTELEKALAEEVIEDVRRRLGSARVETLTESLVHEFVRVVLLERGLDSYEQRYRYLRLPIADAGPIIAEGSDDDTHHAVDPETTSHALAARLKEEYGLLEVFSRAAAEAHARGDFHLHDLGAIDRFSDIAPSLERLKRSGMEMGDGPRGTFAPKEPDALAAQVAGQTAVLQTYISGAVHWEGLNYSFAPYVHQLDAAAKRDLARVLFYELALRAFSDRSAATPVSLSLHWDVPAHMYGVELVGPGGAYTERTCADYIDDARSFALALLEVYKEVSAEDVSIPVPALVLHLSPYALDNSDGRAFLEAATGAVSPGASVLFRCESSPPLLPHAGDLLSPVRVVAHRITLNLPRAALRGRDLEGVLRELDRMLELAVQAHVQKRSFLERLLSAKGAPLAFLRGCQEGRAMIDLANATFAIGIAGLNECVKALIGEDLHGSAEAARLGETIVGHLRGRCEQWGSEIGMDLSLEPTCDEEVGRRFFATDRELFGDRVVGLVSDRAGSYTEGCAVVDSAPLSSMERIRVESRLHPLFRENAICRVHAPTQAVPELLDSAFVHTPCRGILFE